MRATLVNREAYSQRIHPVDEYSRVITLEFDPTQYGPDVARILALEGNGQRLMPLRPTGTINLEAIRLLKTFKPRDLFQNQEEPEAPMSGLFLYFSFFEVAHQLLEFCETQ